MKKFFFLFVATVFFAGSGVAQLLSWTPDFAKDNDNIVITVDATKGDQGLLNYSNPNDVYVHTGVLTNLSTGPTNWRYSKFTWGSTDPLAKAISLGGNKWQYTINNIRAFYGVPGGETILKITLLFRNGAGTAVQRNTDGSDMYIPVYDNTLAVRFSAPLFQPFYKKFPEQIIRPVGASLPVTAVASSSSAMRLLLNGIQIQTASNATSISASPVITTTGQQVLVAEADDGSTIKKDTFVFVTAEPLPPGMRDGINYEAGNTSAVLVLNAPGKSGVTVTGEFPGSNWSENIAYKMIPTPDGNHWWLRISGLSPGTEYAFQYLVDGSLKIGEPYAEKILDPSNDGAIGPSTYPGLRSYPAGQSGIVSVLQTAAPSYNWAVNNFTRPDKRNLVIYELLLRDFLAAHDWKSLKDTLSYLKRLGINAVQVMPFNEFDGNESWGYNPSYFLAPDKYYGPKNSLKEFVDSCHANGIAVLMDIALNHTTGSNPLAALYWNITSNQPGPNNPWLNVSATHPYNVFNDFNHESLRTRYFTGRVIEHWLQEYKLDGFRWDLSKGFTQNAQCGGSTSNESCISQYHADRVAIWKRYYDTMQLKSPGSICILEHFAENSEETELADYGMLLWGNANYNFSEASMGWVGTSNFDSYLHSARGWSKPHLVSYMESHDEERMMYRNLNFGNNANAAHNVRDLGTALKRVELCAAFFLAAPGPKMIWQFGELGYDFSINRCVDGTINNNCRLDNKPIRWDYPTVIARKRLYDIFSAMNKLRFHPWYRDVFIANNTVIGRNLSGAFKSLTLRSAGDTSMLCVIGNFEVTAQTSTFTFPVGGTWYDYLGGGTFSATGAAQSITLQPGEVHVFLNRNLVNAVVTSTGGVVAPGDRLMAKLYPNPAAADTRLEIYMPKTGRADVQLFNAGGEQLNTVFAGNLAKGIHRIAVAGKIDNLPAGSYWMKITASGQTIPVSLLIQ